MIAKMVLPLLGGSPAVWNTCVLFFQALLLAGYAYAHAARTFLGARKHAPLHLALLLASLLALPVGLRYGQAPLGAEQPVPWLLATLTASVGAPFLLLASTGPLIQHWFADTEAAGTQDPYFLYAVSNAGSLGGLFAYPLVIEPMLSLRSQSRVWTAAYCGLVALMIVCALQLRRLPAGGRSPMPEPSRVRRLERLRWVVLALVPSSLLLGVTTYLTTDVAAVPLLWVLPLAIYLLTFIFAFSRWGPVLHAVVLRWQPMLALVMVIFLFWSQYLTVSALLPVHLLVFFATAMMCHGELAARRPAPHALTEFYLWIAVGGALGSALNVLVAPHLFRSVTEYPLMIALSPALVGGAFVMPRLGGGVVRAVVAVAILLLAWSLVLPFSEPAMEAPGRVVIAALASGFAALICYRNRDGRVLFSATLAAIVLGSAVMNLALPDILITERDFFGVRRVKQDRKERVHILYSGTTEHGAQSTEAALRREPLSYFGRSGPLGDVFQSVEDQRGKRVGVIGLGSGVIAAYAEPGDFWTFYELDPGVERIARDPRYFSYLLDSPTRTEVKLGDGRLSLGHEPDATFDLLILDAFSSDAVPVHLLTTQAVALYLRKTRPGGLVVMHISNRYLDLETVLGRVASSMDLSGLIRDNTSAPSFRGVVHTDPSIWAVLASHPADVVRISTRPQWRPLRTDHRPPWTDDYSNLAASFRFLERH
jgi:hypothetical protein